MWHTPSNHVRRLYPDREPEAFRTFHEQHHPVNLQISVLYEYLKINMENSASQSGGRYIYIYIYIYFFIFNAGSYLKIYVILSTLNSQYKRLLARLSPLVFVHASTFAHSISPSIPSCGGDRVNSMIQSLEQ